MGPQYLIGPIFLLFPECQLLGQDVRLPQDEQFLLLRGGGDRRAGRLGHPLRAGHHRRRHHLPHLRRGALHRHQLHPATLAAVTYLLAVYAILRDRRPGLLVPALLVDAVAVVANITVAVLLLVVTTGHLGAILATLFYLSLATFPAYSW